MARKATLRMLLLAGALALPGAAGAQPPEEGTRASRRAANAAAASAKPASRQVAERAAPRHAAQPPRLVRAVERAPEGQRPARMNERALVERPALRASLQDAPRPGAAPAARPARPARAAQALHPRRPGRAARDPDAVPVLRDAPQELLPAPESLDQARLELPASPRAACLAAARRAEQIHALPAGLLVAVAMSESSLNALAIKVGRNMYYPRDLERAQEILAKAPPRSSPMVGCVQVNARVHAQGSTWPLDPLRSTDWAGGMLRRWHQETGDWVEALRRWHGGSARTEHGVLCRVRAKLEVANPENDMLRDYPCQDTAVAARTRREGRGILEVAEVADLARVAAAPTEASAGERAN